LHDLVGDQVQIGEQGPRQMKRPAEIASSTSPRVMVFSIFRSKSKSTTWSWHGLGGRWLGE
jgi:hypothetical protein